jgi:hypothetical protein
VTIEDIARACHEVNREYCLALGDDSQNPWAEAPDWQRASAINGVEFHRDHPEAGPEYSHESWLREKAEAGWIFGEVKNPEKKEHPCFIPFNELPTEQKAKDYIFRGLVHALVPNLNANEMVDSGPVPPGSAGINCAGFLVPQKHLPQWVFVATDLARIGIETSEASEEWAAKLVAAAKILTGGL